MRSSFALLLLVLPLGTASAQADGRITFLSRQLSKASDARARAQAAIMLGKTGEAQALQPLCGGLKDPSDVVRVAAARALADLAQPGGEACLRTARADTSAEVRDAVAKALSVFAAAAEQKYYVHLQPLADRTSSLGPELLRLTEDRLRAKLSTMGTVFAPQKETKAQARTVLKSKGLKGYSLKVELLPAPSNGLKLNVLCFTYPDQSLLGEVNVKASGAQAADLIRALAPKAIEEAADTFDWRS